MNARINTMNLMKLSNLHLDLFDMANSYAGDKYGVIAVQIHYLANLLLDVSKILEPLFFGQSNISADPQHSREPDKVKPCLTCGGDKKVWNEGQGSGYIAGSVNTRGWQPCPDCQNQKPSKVKPLAQYLAEYIEHECGMVDVFTTSGAISWRELLEQALDAYQSTENVTIKIERV